MYIQSSQSLNDDSVRRRAIYKLGMRLVQVARNSQLDEPSLRVFLKHLKNQYIQNSESNEE